METIPVMATTDSRLRAIQRRNTRAHAIRFACALWALLLMTTITGAQVERQNPATGPELARHNLAQVGASAEDIKVVLVKSPGLMVEVKRWVAKDATDQGQIITERDLADDAIFERLQDDVRFRSVVTQLLQRYGYLMPVVNPDSAAGREQELLVQERVKWLAQEEEQQRAQAAQRALDRYENARRCLQGDLQRAAKEGRKQGQQQLPQEPVHRNSLRPIQVGLRGSGPGSAKPVRPNHRRAETAQFSRPSLCKRTGSMAMTNFHYRCPEEPAGFTQSTVVGWRGRRHVVPFATDASSKMAGGAPGVQSGFRINKQRARSVRGSP